VRAGTAALALLAVLLDPAAARAQRFHTVTLLGVSGPGGEMIGQVLEDTLGEAFAMIPGAAYKAQAEAFGRTGASPAEVRDVARAVGTDVVLAGQVRQKHGRWTFRLVARDGGTGEVLGRVDEPLGAGGKLDPKTRRHLLSRTVLLIDRAVGVHRPQEEAGVAEAEPQPGGGEEAEEGEEPGEEEEPWTPPRRPTVRKAAPPVRGSGDALALDAGYAVLGRFLDVDAPGAIGYHSGAVSALRFDAALFPFAWTASLARAHPVLAVFGFAATAVVALPFSSVSAVGDSVPARAHRWDAALAARVPLGGSGVRLRFASGYGETRYESDEPSRLGVPDVQYRYLRESLLLGLPLGTDKVALDVGAAVLGLLATGPIGGPSEYGSASGWGLDVDAGLVVHATSWLFFRAAVHYEALFLGFHGGGARIGNGARDQLVDGGLMVGLASR
jgi:hypothetical protein